MFRAILLLALALGASALRLGAAPGTPHCRRAAATAAPPRLAAPRLAAEDSVADAAKAVKDAAGRMKKSVASVEESLSTLRVGRAAPSLLDRIVVEYYGAPTPLNQLAAVSAPTASQLVVDVFDKSALGDVEKALFESDLGMTPQSDGKVIRLNVPQLTAERRKELAKTAKSLGEDGKVRSSPAPSQPSPAAYPCPPGLTPPRPPAAAAPARAPRAATAPCWQVALRNVRRDAVDRIKKMKKALGEDVAKDKEDEVQKALKKHEAEVEAVVKKKEKEITTI